MTNHMTSKRLLLIVCFSLLLLTLISCSLGEVLDEAEQDVGWDDHRSIEQKEATEDAQWEADETKTATAATKTKEAATLIAEVATHEAKATGTAEAEDVEASIAEEEAEEPAPIEDCNATGAWCIVEARCDLGPEYPEDSFEQNEVNISFPVDGGEVSGDFHLVFRQKHLYHGEVECVELHEHTGALSGHYNPGSRELEGVVHGYKWSWEVFEGCKNIQTVDTGDDPTSWWATYDPTTGELHGDVTWQTEDGEVQIPFHGAEQSRATADAIAAAETTEAHSAATAQAIETAEAQAEAESIEDANYQATADARAQATAEAEYQSTADALADAESVDASQTPSITPCCVAPQVGKGLLWFENHIGEIVEVDVGPTHYMVPPKENGIAGCLCARLDPGYHTVAVHTRTHSGTFEIDIVEGQILRFPLSYQGY